MFVNRKGTGALWGGGGTTSRVKVTIRYTVTMCFQGSCQDCHGTRTFRDNPYTEWKIVKRGKRAKVKWNYLGEVAWPECIENPWGNTNGNFFSAKKAYPLARFRRHRFGLKTRGQCQLPKVAGASGTFRWQWGMKLLRPTG